MSGKQRFQWGMKNIENVLFEKIKKAFVTMMTLTEFRE